MSMCDRAFTRAVTCGDALTLTYANFGLAAANFVCRNAVRWTGRRVPEWRQAIVLHGRGSRYLPCLSRSVAADAADGRQGA